MSRVISVAVAAIVLAAACGDDAGPTATPEQNDAIARLIDAELTGDEHLCVLEGLIETGVSPAAIVADETSVEDDIALLDVAVGCIDDLARIPSFVQGFIDGAAAEGTEMTEAEAICAIRHLEADDPAAAAEECLADTALDDAGTDDIVADTYGDDDVLDLMWDACDDGNNLVCDELAALAPAGSAYAAFGATCGQRLPERALGCFDELG